MTEQIGNIIILRPELPQQCDLCGKVGELRPYGPNGECICFDCGMKSKKTTEEAFKRLLFGE
jgi:hypothetical protein